MIAARRASDQFHVIWGWNALDKWERHVALFSARLDETGTDGRSKFTLVGGAIAPPESWDALEMAWGALLRRSGIAAYHWKEFNDPHDDTFGKWSRLKRERFVTAQEKIIGKCTSFRVAVGVESAVHADVKNRMKGITGFHPDSDYTLCLRWLMFWACDELSKVDPQCRLSILVEDGPWASGAMQTYQRVAAMTGKRKPAKHAHRLAGFGSAPKGERLSLEAADYLAGSSLERLLAGRQRKARDTLAVLLTKPLLEQWYEGMIAEKEVRREYARSKKLTFSGQSS
jgi:hypothetical protein